MKIMEFHQSAYWIILEKHPYSFKVGYFYSVRSNHFGTSYFDHQKDAVEYFFKKLEEIKKEINKEGFQNETGCFKRYCQGSYQANEQAD